MARIVDDTILQPVHRIALIVDHLREQRKLLHRNGGLAHLRLAGPDAAHRIARVVEARGADYQSVKILGVTLRLLKPLAATGGTPDPVGISWRGAIVCLNHLLGQYGRFMHREIGEVEEFPVAVRILGRLIGEDRQRLLGSRRGPYLWMRRRNPYGLRYPSGRC